MLCVFIQLKRDAFTEHRESASKKKRRVDAATEIIVPDDYTETHIPADTISMTNTNTTTFEADVSSPITTPTTYVLNTTATITDTTTTINTTATTSGTIGTNSTPISNPVHTPSPVETPVGSNSCGAECEHKSKCRSLQKTKRRLQRRVAELKQRVKELQSVSGR